MPRRGNLPAEATSFIGRDAELRLAARLLTEARLITVVGPGGVGKSRLVLRAGAEARFPDGVWLAQLAPVTEASLLGHVLVEALGLVDGTAREPLAVLTDALRDQELLLVLDGCEHLLPEAAALVAALLAAAPGLRVLATSRQPLGAPGEHLLPLSPLPSDGPDTEAVRLFLQRAAAVVPDFALTEQNRAQIVSLCHRLDGIPLAIELAAGRLRALSLQQILDRLDDRFRLLAAPSRLALPATRPCAWPWAGATNCAPPGAVAVGPALRLRRSVRPGGGRVRLRRRHAPGRRDPRRAQRACRQVDRDSRGRPRLRSALPHAGHPARVRRRVAALLRRAAPAAAPAP
ncbi:ATP-binding protein [Streptacidiphilus monticola]